MSRVPPCTTISLMVPYFDSILGGLRDDTNHFRMFGSCNEDADAFANGTKIASEKLLKYFSISSDLAVAATVLDPRLKLKYY